MLLLPSLSVIQTHKSARAGTFSGPNGQLVFSSSRDDNYELYSMNDDGTDRTRLTDNDDSLDREPSWSLDGEKITFVSYRDTTEGDEIYSINAMMEVM
jgi:Tol biopolymer transport system component